MRITVRRMMVVIAVAGLCFATFRIHPSLGGLVASVFCLSLMRIFGTIDRSQARGTPMRCAEVVRISVGSALIAATFLLASLIPSVFIVGSIRGIRGSTGCMRP
jgi:hypothetical protein